METLKRAYTSTKESIRSMVEWRSAASAPYLMLINTAFWWMVFYVRGEVQQKALVALAAGVFGWDVLLSSSHHHSVIMHLAWWPLHNVLRTVSVLLALLGAHKLRNEELEKACWMAYSTVALLLVNPVWQYQKVPERMSKTAYDGYCIIKTLATEYVFHPTLKVFTVVEYVVLLRWMPELIQSLRRSMVKMTCGIRSRCLLILDYLVSLPRKIGSWTIANIRSFANFLKSSLIAIRSWIVDGLKNIANAIANGFKATGRAIRSAFLACCSVIYRALSAIGAFIRARTRQILDWFKAKITALNHWIKTRIVDVTIRRARAIGAFLRYWLCAHWWPILRRSFVREIGVPIQRVFNYVCYWMVYVFCGHWIKPLGKWTAKEIKRFAAFVKRTVIRPLARWTKARLDDLYAVVRRALHALAIRVRDSVVWPFCVVVGQLLNEAYNYVHATVMQPICDAVSAKLKSAQDYAYINVLGPACETIVNNIPEKSPFCDDSETELADLLPEGIEDSEGNFSDTEGTSDRISLPSGSLTPLTEDERDLLHGLKFPAIDASESSDEEFDLRRPPNRTLREKRTGRKVPKDPQPNPPLEDITSPRDHCLSLSSTGSLSDGGASMSSTRSDALMNAKLSSMGESFSDGDPTVSEARIPSDRESASTSRDRTSVQTRKSSNNLNPDDSFEILDVNRGGR